MDVCCCLREDWVQDGWSFSIRTDQTGYVRNVSGMRCRTVHKRRNDIERQVTDMKMCPQLPFFSFLFYYRQISINDVPFLFTWFGDKTGLMGWNDNPEGLKFQSGTTFASFSPTLILCVSIRLPSVVKQDVAFFLCCLSLLTRASHSNDSTITLRLEEKCCHPNIY